MVASDPISTMRILGDTSAAVLLDSIASSFSPSSAPPSSRCEGLDLLAAAAMHAIKASECKKESFQDEDASIPAAGGEESLPLATRTRTKRRTWLPSRLRDSVLQPWKRRTRGPHPLSKFHASRFHPFPEPNDVENRNVKI